MKTPEMTSDAETARLCSNCAASMERHQDWCLECGTAAPGRLGALRPGWRAVTTTLALTLVLVGGAGAASYAALSSDANREALAAAPTDGAPVAQAPPAVPAPAAPVSPAAVPVEPPAAPKVKAPAAELPVAPKPVPVVTPPVANDKTLAQVTPAPAKKPAAAPVDDTTAGSRGAGTNSDGRDTAADADLKPVAIPPGAVAVYDPFKRAQAAGDPGAAHDGDTKTTFEIGAPDDGKPMQVGVVIDLGAAKQVRGVEFTTTTPGGRVEIYATDGSALPPDILDTRWDHPASRKDVDVGDRGGNIAGDGMERILFPKGGKKFRYVTLWFTTPPKGGAAKVALAELKVLG